MVIGSRKIMSTAQNKAYLIDLFLKTIFDNHKWKWQDNWYNQWDPILIGYFLFENENAKDVGYNPRKALLNWLCYFSTVKDQW